MDSGCRSNEKLWFLIKMPFSKVDHSSIGSVQSFEQLFCYLKGFDIIT